MRELRTYFAEDGRVVKAVDGVSFDVKRGETLGIVGESGSGKSVTNLSIMRLIPTPPGTHRERRGDIRRAAICSTLADAEMRAIRGKRIAMIFQDPMTSLNPFMRISKQLMEVTQLHLGHSRSERVRTRGRACSKRSAFPTRAAASTTIRMSFPAACASA